jgi:tetratricopeptide (TPR) repeat protein
VGLFAGCAQPYISTVKVSPPTSGEIGALSEEIKRLVRELEYSDKVAEDVTNMVIGWKDGRGHPALAVWKKQLLQVRNEHTRGQISGNELAQFEEIITIALSQRIHIEIAPKNTIELSELVDVIRYKKANCVGYTQLVHILGNSIGLCLKAIEVRLLVGPKMEPGEFVNHVATIVSLTSGEMIMVDPAQQLISKPFRIEEEYTKVDNYYELKAKHSPAGFHRTIRVLDTKGPIVALHINRGVAYGRARQYDRAISEYSRCIQLDPQDPRAYWYRGCDYSRSGKTNEADKDLNKALAVDHQYVIDWVFKQDPVAGKKFLEFYQSNSNDARSFVKLGNDYYHSQQYSKSISEYDKAIDLNPNHATAYYNRGIALTKLGRRLAAISDCNKAIELDPSYAAAYNNRGSVYTSLGKHNTAIKDYNKVIELDPKYAVGYYNRGNTYASLRKFEEAVRDYSIAVALGPELVTKLGKVLNSWKKTNPDIFQGIVSRMNRSLASSLSVEPGKGMPASGKTNKLSPKDAAGYVKRGNAYYRSRQYSKAISEYSKAIGLDSNYASAYYNRGNSYASLKNLEQAKKDLLKAVELNPALKPNVKKSSDNYKLNLNVD